MSEPITKSGAKAPTLRIIQGGLLTANADAAQRVRASSETEYRHSGKVTPGQEEEDRLGAAILRLVLPELGITVLSALDEMCDRADSFVDGDVARFLILKAELERLGIRYVIARPEFDLVRNGYLTLTWPDRLVRRHPELCVFHPEAHPGMAMG